jgi:hypothetical protein
MKPRPKKKPAARLNIPTELDEESEMGEDEFQPQLGDNYFGLPNTGIPMIEHGYGGMNEDDL